MTAKAKAKAKAKRPRPSTADPLKLAAEMKRPVAVVSQARVGKRPAIDGLRAATELVGQLDHHRMLLFIGAERDGTDLATIADALGMGADAATGWLRDQLELHPDPSP